MKPQSVGLLAAKLHSRIEYCLRQADCSSTLVEKQQWLLFASRWQRFAAEEEESDISVCYLADGSGSFLQRLEAHASPQAEDETKSLHP